MTYDELVEEYAILLRAHTLAVWAINGELVYPKEERETMGLHAVEVLRKARATPVTDSSG